MKTFTLFAILFAFSLPATAQTPFESPEALTTCASLLNPLLGLGSFLQGDPVSGVVVGGGIVAGVVLAKLGSREDRLPAPPSRYGVPASQFTITNDALFSAGIGILVTSIAYGLVAPWLFDRKVQFDKEALRE